MKPDARVNPRPLRCRPLKTKKKAEIRPENGQKQREDIRDAGVYIAVSGGIKPTASRPVVWDAAVCSMGDLPRSNKPSDGFVLRKTVCFLQFLIRTALLARVVSKGLCRFQ